MAQTPDPADLPAPPDLPPPPTIDHPGVDDIQDLVEGDDAEAIEGGRDLVRPHHVPILARAYWASDSWNEKLNIIELTQDQAAPELTEIATDFLRAPEHSWDERTELAKAISLMHIGQEVDETLDDYASYYNDRDLLRRRVDETLDLLGLEREDTPVAPPEPPAEPLTGPADDRLIAAIFAVREDEYRRALADGADAATVIQGGTYDQVSALMAACMQRRYDWARELIERGADVRHFREGHRPGEEGRGQTALWWAANHGRLDMVEHFAALGAEIDMPDTWGSTPLHQAASEGHLEIVQWLVARGADTMARIYDNRTPFNLAATHVRTNVVSWFLDQGHPADQVGAAGYSALMIACENGKIEMAEALINAGADVNLRHPGQGIYTGLRGWTPLVFCVRGGRIKITKYLISRGANVDEIITPAGTGRHDDVPAQRVIHFCHGRQAEKLQRVLIDAGATPA